ncbi:MAG: hypothetical protein Q4B17_12985 [Lautropia sp.]|nr:hypothetical protein [Lautropia sp.]
MLESLPDDVPGAAAARHLDDVEGGRATGRGLDAATPARSVLHQ